MPSAVNRRGISHCLESGHPGYFLLAGFFKFSTDTTLVFFNVFTSFLCLRICLWNFVFYCCWSKC